MGQRWILQAENQTPLVANLGKTVHLISIGLAPSLCLPRILPDTGFFSGAKFPGANFPGAKFSRANFWGDWFSGDQVPGVKIDQERG